MPFFYDDIEGIDYQQQANFKTKFNQTSFNQMKVANQGEPGASISNKPSTNCIANIRVEDQ